LLTQAILLAITLKGMTTQFSAMFNMLHSITAEKKQPHYENSEQCSLFSILKVYKFQNEVGINKRRVLQPA